MTCSRVLYGLLAVLFGYVVITVAAFRYLEWWQAILASAATLIIIVIGAKLLVKAAVRRLGAVAQGLMEQHTKALKNASVDVHTVRSIPPPAETTADTDEFDRVEAAADLRNIRWYEIELSIFPDREQADPSDAWSPESLVLVPATAKPPLPFGTGRHVGGDSTEIVIRSLKMIVDGEPMSPDHEVTGPHRLRFIAGVPSGMRELTLRYVVHQFGRIRLPAPALSAPDQP